MEALCHCHNGTYQLVGLGEIRGWAMKVDFTVKRKRTGWEIIAKMEEANSVQIWRSRTQPTVQEFRVAVFAAAAGMSAMAEIAGLRMEIEHPERLVGLLEGQ